jgi:ribonuclease P protein component
MLPRAARLTTGRDFSETVRNGRRAGARSLVVHLEVGSGTSPQPSRAGLVVSRAVGASVTRNRVKRRLRHLLRVRLGGLPPASRLVVRALPPAASASSDELDRDLGSAVDRALHRSSPRGSRR